MENVSLSLIEESLLVAAYYRGGSSSDEIWRSNSDQIITLSLFYTGELSSEDCAERFSDRCGVAGQYQEDGELTVLVKSRYAQLLKMLQAHPELIEGAVNFETPVDPIYTSCRLTEAGMNLARQLIPSLPQKPEFSKWPDKRTFP